MQPDYQTGGPMDSRTCIYSRSRDTKERADLQDVLVDLADGFKHGIHFATGCHNGTLVRVHHVLHHIRALGLRGADLGWQVQLVVPLPDVGANHLQHSAFSLKKSTETVHDVHLSDNKQVWHIDMGENNLSILHTPCTVSVALYSCSAIR